MGINFPIPSAEEYKRQCYPLISIIEYNIIERIISLEAAIYVMRQTPGGYGLYVDTLSDERDKVIREFEVLGEEYQEKNNSIIWS